MTVLGKMGDITVPTFCILNCNDGGRDIAENSRPPVPRRLASEMVGDIPGKGASSWESWVTIP